MKRFNTLIILIGLLIALLALGACGPFALGTATPRPTVVWPGPTTGAVTDTPEPATATTEPTGVVPATDVPTQEPGVTATDTVAPVATDTPTVPPTATATNVPPTPTQTATRVPPTPTRTSVPPTRTPVPPTPTQVTITDWRGEYYDNIALQGSPKVVRNDRVVDFNLPKGTAPATNMPSENWSARWSRTWRFDEGNYRFHLLVDDGARLWVADRLLIDAWADGGAREFTAELYLRGDVSIRLEYYNRLGDARVRLNWEPVTQYAGWKGSYFGVRDLTGLPIFQRDDANIDFNWGTGSPRADVPADNFSVRWTRTQDFQAGRYRFDAFSDDGVRVYVDDRLVIDAWKDGQSGYQGTIDLTAGRHEVRVLYYEHTGQALIKVTWTQVSGPTATPTATRTTEPPTATPTRTTVPTVPPTAPPTVPPTVPPTAPPTVVPGRPAIVLNPAAGQIGRPFNVNGMGWPASAAVDLYLLRASRGSGSGPQTPVGQAVADGSGNFQVSIAIPAGEGWEGEEAARVVALAPGLNLQAQAVFRIRPELQPLRYAAIPADEDRFALAEPTYLALNSAEAWAQWFGAEPPRVQTPIDWGREVVLGAFLGEQPAGMQAGVESVVQRGRTVTVHLNAPTGGGGSGIVGSSGSGSQAGNRPRVLIRVPREVAEDSSRAQLTYVFVNAQGAVLAQGPAGAAALPPAGARAMSLQAPQVGVGGGVTETQALTARGMTETQAMSDTGEQTTTVEQAPAAPQPAEIIGQATSQTGAQATPEAGLAAPTVTPGPGDTLPGRNLAVWALIILGLVALAVLAVYLIRRYR